MSLYKLVDCVCGHAYNGHILGCNECIPCTEYDPAGYNPELENILCPNCTLIRLEKLDGKYACIACKSIFTESEILEIVG